MKKMLLFCTAVLLASTAFGQEVCTVEPLAHPDSADWEDLFAPDLSNAFKPKGVWTIENGELTASKDEAI